MSITAIESDFFFNIASELGSEDESIEVSDFDLINCAKEFISSYNVNATAKELLSNYKKRI